MPSIDAGGTALRRARVWSSLLLAVFALSVALWAPPSGDAREGSQRPLIQSGGRGQYKPADFCPSNHTCFSSAEWIRWDQKAVALAVGTTSYPGAPEVSEQIRVTLWRVRNICGGRRYTRARWQYSGDSQPTESSFLKLGGCGYWTGA